uniref:Uncharacterized protein n=1 Tax=Romanomermis culicivorax TaxID=13658 RepID=A0A915KSW2_ROMCU
MCKKNLDDNKFVFTTRAPIAVVFTIALSTIFNTLSAQCVARLLDFSQLSVIKARRTRLLVHSVNGSVIILCRRFRRTHKNFWSEAVWKNVEQQITLSKSSDDPQILLRRSPHNLAKNDGKQRDSTTTKSSRVSEHSLTVSGKGLDSAVGQTQLVD